MKAVIAEPQRSNLDLTSPRGSASDFAGVQPSIGDNTSRYQGWAEGNPDLQF